jgi:hypothetical protein
VHYKLPCGRVISSTGLPEGLEVEKLEKILQGMLQNQPKRHVLLKINLLIPTAIDRIWIN